VKRQLLCPPPAESRINQPGLMVVDERRLNGYDLGEIEGLGEINPQIRITVTDRRGEPAPGISVTVQPSPGVGVSGTTDDDGVFIAPMAANTQTALVTADLPEGSMVQSVSIASDYANTVAFRSIRKINGPLLTPTEMVLGGVGAITTAVGFLKDIEFMKWAGELMIVGTVFLRIGRG
jgi:hypothetical protein